MKKFHFGVKYDVLSKKENGFFLKKCEVIFDTHGLMNIFNKFSKFQNDLINIYFRTYNILKSYPYLKKFCDVTYCVLSMDRCTYQPVAVDS